MTGVLRGGVQSRFILAISIRLNGYLRFALHQRPLIDGSALMRMALSASFEICAGEQAEKDIAVRMRQYTDEAYLITFPPPLRSCLRKKQVPCAGSMGGIYQKVDGYDFSAGGLS